MNQEDEIEKEALLYYTEDNKLLAEWDMIDKYLEEGEKHLIKKNPHSAQ